MTSARLGGKQVPLTCPVQIELSGETGAWIAENSTLEVFGDGPSRQAAIRSFVERFEHFLSYYMQLSWDDVAGNGARLKGIYDGLAGAHAGQNR